MDLALGDPETDAGTITLSSSEQRNVYYSHQTKVFLSKTHFWAKEQCQNNEDLFYNLTFLWVPDKGTFKYHMTLRGEWVCSNRQECRHMGEGNLVKS